MSQFTHKNHYVPQFYLKQWSKDGARIWEYKLLVSNNKVPIWNNSSIEDATGWHRDLYTGLIDGKEIDEVEHWYDYEIEEPAQKVFEKISNNENPSKHDLHKLLRFVAAQYVRTPAAYFRSKTSFENRSVKSIKKDYSDLTDESTNYLLTTKSSTEYSKYSKYFPCKVEIGNFSNANQNMMVKFETGFTRNMWHFINYTVLNNTYTCLLENDWHIVEAPTGVKLYTSDDPVVCVNYSDNETYDFHGGWGKKNGNVFFPISPKHFLFTEIGVKTNEYFIKNNLLRLSYWMQRITIENAFRSIYSQSNENLLKLCRERTVDEAEFRKERYIWEHWNETQCEFEDDFRK